MQDLNIEELEIPEWGGLIYVRAMTSRERDQYDDYLGSHSSNHDERAKIASMTICDKNGNFLFGEDDLEALGAKSGDVLGRILQKSMTLNGLDADQIEEAEKN